MSAKKNKNAIFSPQKEEVMMTSLPIHSLMGSFVPNLGTGRRFCN